MAKAGIARGDAEGPQDFATRIAVTRPELAPATDAITRLYVSLRYQEEENNNKNKYLQQLQQHIKALPA
jgi:hypothetical protein